MMIDHGGRYWVLRQMWLYADPSPMIGPAAPETYRGRMVAYETAERKQAVDEFGFDSPIYARQDGGAAVLAWLVTEGRLQGGTVIPSPLDPTTYDREGDGWVLNLAKLTDKLCADVKRAARRLRMTVTTPGDDKATIYPAKAAEVVAWDALGDDDDARQVAYDALPDDQRGASFRYAAAEAALTGDAAGIVVSRFRAGIAQADTLKAAVEAIEQQACRAIAAADTAEAKQAVVDAIDWSWNP